MGIRFAAISVAVVAATIGLAPAAHANGDGDFMYRVGSEIQPGDYMFKVVGNGSGSWELCSDATCDVGGGLIDMDTADGMGHTGYLTVPASAKFLKTNDLYLTPA
jgi:hypothetical protein